MLKKMVIVALLFLGNFSSAGAAQASNNPVPAKNGGLSVDIPSKSEKKKQSVTTVPNQNAAGETVPNQTATVISTSEPSKGKYEKDPSKEDIEIQKQLAKFTKYLVWVGVVQALVLAGTLLLIYWQANIMEKHAGHLENLATSATANANAALLNAEALINAERPWVAIQIKSEPGATAAQSIFKINVFNYGKSPAHITSYTGLQVEFLVDLDRELPIPPKYDSTDWEQTFLAPKDSFTVSSVDPSAESRKLIERAIATQKISKPNLTMVVYGRIGYRDGVSLKTYTTAFCYYHHRVKLSDMGGRLLRCGPEVYNQYT